jgi:hypothetical protein
MKYARLPSRSSATTAFCARELGRGAGPRRAGFRDAVAATGPNTYGMLSCSKATNEVNFIAQKFTRVAIGTNNIDSCNRT